MKIINLLKRLFTKYRPLTKSMILEKAKCYKTTGLCSAIKSALRYYGYDIHCTDASKIRDILQIPLYDIKEAVKFNADPGYANDTGYWWRSGIWYRGRLDYLNWLINQYKNDKTDLKEYLKDYIIYE